MAHDSKPASRPSRFQIPVTDEDLAVVDHILQLDGFQSRTQVVTTALRSGLSILASPPAAEPEGQPPAEPAWPALNPEIVYALACSTLMMVARSRFPPSNPVLQPLINDIWQNSIESRINEISAFVQAMEGR